jgi:hypothetical protein
MEYSKLVAVTGLPGLYELISSKSDGAVVRSLDDGSTRFAATRSHNFSHLESIEIFTVNENVNLADIFHAIEKAGGSLPDAKDNDAVKKYFEKVFPDMDFERVYTSDMKKMVKWYEVLKKNNIEIKLSEPPVEEETPEPAIVEEEKPKKAKAENLPAGRQGKKEEPPAKKKEEPKAEKKGTSVKKPATKAKKEEKKETPKKAAKKK